MQEEHKKSTFREDTKLLFVDVKRNWFGWIIGLALASMVMFLSEYYVWNNISPHIVAADIILMIGTGMIVFGTALVVLGAIAGFRISKIEKEQDS